MKAIMVMYDSLNRHLMPSYGCDLIKMPNFQRLQARAVTFDQCYVGSMPCIPARRELHTGRLNFLHRSWGPVEPYDDSMPALLKNNGIHTHLATDHGHYFEDGGATYHERYSTWTGFRGQEGDPWKGSLSETETIQMFGLERMEEGYRKMRKRLGQQDMINRCFQKNEKEFPQTMTFADGLDFIDRNHRHDGWFLQIETFDPHEPYFSPDDYLKLYQDDEKPSFWDWPPYAKVNETEEQIQAVRNRYFALATMCDRNLGKVLDSMDRYNLWSDTMLIVNTDHGFLLGEHGWWGKNIMPMYDEIAHTPLFIWDPRTGKNGERRQSLVQTIDLAPTLLDYFGVDIPKDMLGRTLKDTIASDTPVRQFALFGMFGDSINITDGRYVYMRGAIRPDGMPLFEHTLMPTHMHEMFSVEELRGMSLAEPFSFTKGCRTMKIDAGFSCFATMGYRYGNQLYNLENDPEQMACIDDPALEINLINAMKKLMVDNDAPAEQFERVGIPRDADMTLELLLSQRAIQNTEQF